MVVVLKFRLWPMQGLFYGCSDSWLMNQWTEDLFQRLLVKFMDSFFMMLFFSILSLFFFKAFEFRFLFRRWEFCSQCFRSIASLHLLDWSLISFLILPVGACFRKYTL